MRPAEPLSTAQFNSFIRAIKQTKLENVKALRAISHTALKRLRVRRDMTKAVKGLPEGSNQVNVGSLITFLETVPKKNKEAVQQVIAIDATATARVKS